MHARKALLVIFMVLCFSLLATAQEPVTFVVHGATGAIESYKALFAQFTAETGIKVELIHVNSAIAGKWEQIIVMTAGGVSPDIVSGVSTEFGEYALNGMLDPLDPYMEKDGSDKRLLMPAFTEALQLNGKQYILPYGSSALVMMYNADHFGMVGLAEPPLAWGSSWTWEQFVETARKLTKSNGDLVERWGIAGFPVAELWQTVPYAFGGRWVSDDLTEFQGADEKTLTALQNYADLAHVDRVLNPAGGQGGLSNFQSGRDSMTGVGTWVLPRMVGAGANWNYMPWFQYNSHDPAGVLFPIGYGILSASRNKENAWELIKWLTWNAQANSEYALSAGALPSLLRNLPVWIEKQQGIFGKDLRASVIAQQVQTYNAVVNIRKSPAFSKIDPVLRSTVQSIFNNQRAARTAMESVESTINQFLREALD